MVTNGSTNSTSVPEYVFFTLPAELRKEVYSCILFSGSAAGDTTIDSMRLTCQQLKEEIEQEVVHETQQLLKKREKKFQDPSYAITLPNTYAESKCLRVSFPVAANDGSNKYYHSISPKLYNALHFCVYHTMPHIQTMVIEGLPTDLLSNISLYRECEGGRGTNFSILWGSVRGGIRDVTIRWPTIDCDPDLDVETGNCRHVDSFWFKQGKMGEYEVELTRDSDTVQKYSKMKSRHDSLRGVGTFTMVQIRTDL